MPQQENARQPVGVRSALLNLTIASVNLRFVILDATEAAGMLTSFPSRRDRCQELAAQAASLQSFTERLLFAVSADIHSSDHEQSWSETNGSEVNK
jgi:hypothetical protein